MSSFLQLISLQENPGNFVRVCFSNRGMAEVVKSVRSLTDDSPDKENVVDIAEAVSDLQVNPVEPESFPSIPELLGIDYVGYVIEKERLDKATGNWQRIDEYRIIGSKANSFKDSRVAYGNCYRYRIKSVIKATSKEKVRTNRSFDLAKDIQRFEQEQVKKELKSKLDVISTIDRVTNLGLTSKVSQGILPTTFDIVQGLSIASTPERTDVVSVPISDVRDSLRNMRRLKNLRVADLDFMRGTISKQRLQKSMNKALARFREDLFEYLSFYYESNPSRNWVYVSVVEDIPPPPPTAILISPNTPKGYVSISWLKPPNSQRDIKFFRVYKRRNVGDSWRSLRVLREKDNVFIDRIPVDDEGFIYALTSIDAHGIESFLSTQIRARLNPSYQIEQVEKPLKWISGSGVSPEKEENDLVLKKFRDVELPTVVNNSVRVGPTFNFNETEKNLILRVKSLDTHEVKEIKVNLKNINVRDRGRR